MSPKLCRGQLVARTCVLQVRGSSQDRAAALKSGGLRYLAVTALPGTIKRFFRSLPAVVIAILISQVASKGQSLPGTEPLEMQGDLAMQMVDGMHRFLDRETAASITRRQSLWKRDLSSPEAYETSVRSNRDHFREIIGLIDARVEETNVWLEATVGRPSLVPQSRDGYEVHAVRWPVLRGMDAEGLLLQPTRPPAGHVVALPDADWSPEMLAGLAPGIPPQAQFARRLAENGFEVLIPALIDRRDTWSGNPRIRFTNMPHREFIYRMAFELGRHPIGYEVQKVLAAVDWFSRSDPKLPIGVIGHGEGGLLALYSAAADTRIKAAYVSGYFQPRQELWSEPIYRNVWGLLGEFGDAELAGLIAPRTLVIESSRAPEISGPSPETPQRAGAAPGRLTTPELQAVLQEVRRARPVFEQLGVGDHLVFVASGEGKGEPGSEQALLAFVRALGLKGPLKRAGTPARDARPGFDSEVRLRHQFDQMVEFTQEVLRRSARARRDFWSKADASSIEQWRRTSEPYRRYLWEEVIGRLPDPSEPLVAKTRKSYDQPRWTGYEVWLPVWPDVFAYGILLLPKDLKPGERRPVVVCQHGLEGRPQDLLAPTVSEAAESYYHRFAAQLADRGFVVYAPQNPYIGGERFRLLMRKANPLKLTIFSLIIGQHQRTLEWLAEQPFVDPNRMAFYGLSYGGKTAMRVPPLLDRYVLSICSGDFNEWVWKVAGYENPESYIYGVEYDMLEFDFANTFNYAEMASLMAPRPFMVERGHSDPVATDEWVAYEYAKVRRFYALLGISDRTEIEFFNGPHTIHGVGTFEFLHRHLNWPSPAPDGTGPSPK